MSDDIPVRGSGNYASDEQKEIARLKRELRDAQDALDVLKKLSAFWKITEAIYLEVSEKTEAARKQNLDEQFTQSENQTEHKVTVNYPQGQRKSVCISRISGSYCKNTAQLLKKGFPMGQCMYRIVSCTYQMGMAETV